MKARTVVVLAVLVAVLAAFIWFVERDLPSSEERAERAKTLLPFEAAEVTGVTIEWDGRTVRMERSGREDGESEAEEDGDGSLPPGAAWRIVEPFEARADGAEIDRFLESLAGLESARSLDDAERAAVGLDPPRGRLVLQTREAARGVQVGAPVPTSDDVVVARTSGDRPEEIHVTSGGFVERLRRAPDAWRDRDVFPATRNAVARLTLSAPRGPREADGAGEERHDGAGGTVALVRAGEFYRIEEPIAGLADADRVDELLSELVGLRVERFVDEPATAGGIPEGGEFTPVAGVLQADLEGGDSFRLELGPPVAEPADRAGAETRLARADGQLVTVSTSLPALLGLEPAAWRSPAWTALRSFQVEAVEIEGAGSDAALRLGREGGEWLRDGDPVAYTAVADLLAAVTEARGEVVDDPAAVAGAPEEPILELRLSRRQHDPVHLSLHRLADGAALATSSERSAAVRLDAETAEGVLAAVEALRQGEPPEPDTGS